MMTASKILILLGLATFALSAIAEVCPSTYLRFSPKHTYCLPANRSCHILSKGVTADQAKDIVRIHNELRNRIAMGKETIGLQPPAMNMLQMVWNEELAKVAQKHAEQCLFDHDCNKCRQIGDFSVGQNLYSQWTSRKTPLPTPDWHAAIKSWYDEVKDFSINLIHSFKLGTTFAMIGHYTQVVWASTWQVGCGHVTYSDNGVRQLYTCNYGPAGNVRSQKMYKTGEACKDCPGNTCCGKSCGDKQEYPGLCKVLDGKTPSHNIQVTDKSKNYDYQCDFSKGSDCHIETPSGMKPWKITHTLSASYAEILLNGGESSTLNFAKKLRSHSRMCFSFEYKKGSNVAGQASNSVAKLILHSVETNSNTEVPLRMDSNNFMKFNMNMNYGYDTDVKLAFTFSVSKGAPPQFFAVTNIIVKSGRC